jgi:hypothetical protein
MTSSVSRTSIVALTAALLAAGIAVNDAVSNGCLQVQRKTDASTVSLTSEDTYATTSPIYGLTAAGIDAIARRNVTADNQPTATMLLPPDLLDGPVWSARREWRAWRRHLGRHGPSMKIIERRRGWLNLRPTPGTPSLESEPVATSFSAAGWFQRATVWTEPTDNADTNQTGQRCPRASPLNYHCAVPSWKWVRWWPMTVEGDKHGCIWAHPLADQTIHVRGPFPSERGRLTIRTALFDGVVGDGGEVRLAARIGDRQVVHRHPDERGWRTADLTSGADDTLHVKVRADSVGRRHFCFDLDWQPESALTPDRHSPDGAGDE